MKFESFYFYTNQRELKKYLVNYKIEPSIYSNEQVRTLSDLGQNFLLFWKSEIGAETILKNCKTYGGDIPVVLKVLLPVDTVVEAYFPDGTVKEAKISDCATAYVVKYIYPVSFFNVSDIFYVDEQIQFLQGDTTLIIPKRLMRNEPFAAVFSLDDNIVDNVKKSFSKAEEDDFTMNDENDEIEYDTDIFSSFSDRTTEETAETEEEKTIREKSKKDDKLIAAYLMFIQWKKLFNGRFSHRIYSVIGSPEIPFDKVIRDYFYKNVSMDIVFENIKYLPTEDVDYISSLREEKFDDVYTPAISVLVNNDYYCEDRERFLNDYLAGIKDVSQRNKISEIFADRRARNRIKLLANDIKKLVPLYFLYTFFDYRLDRFCDNIIEFGLDKEGLANITLSLWALLHGMSDIYSEYKNLELIYAITCKVSDSCIDYAKFVEINKITSRENGVVLYNLACNYINHKIEYYHCAGKEDKKINKMACNLQKELKKMPFDFRYAMLNNSLKSVKPEISDEEIIANKDIIHNGYLKLLQNNTQKAEESSKANQIQTTIWD